MPLPYRVDHEDDDLNIFSDALLAWMDETGIDEEDISAQVGISTKSIRNYLKRIQQPSLPNALKISRVFNITLTQFLEKPDDQTS
jgi:transcriptional regulator with XRE-family HTH domain